MTDQQLNEIRDGFDQRVKQAFEAERGKPFVPAKKRPPLKEGRGNYVRHYSWSIMDFATRCFWLDEQIDEANAALRENAQHYLDNPKDINDQDSFHWHAGEVCRLIEFYGSSGSIAPGRLTSETENLIMEPMWIYSNKCVQPEESNPKKTWYIPGSDNHHSMHFLTKWHFAKLAKEHPDYKNRKFSDGLTAADHYAAWNEYIKAYCLERAKKGLFTEFASDGYNVVGTKGFHNVVDFADDPVLKRRAGYLLDLHWAMWAQEQIDGVRGGGRTRIYQTGSDRQGNTELRNLAWFYFGIGKPSRPLSPFLPALTSSYRPPLVVVDLALDVDGRGKYEILHRPMGLAEPGYDKHSELSYRLQPKGGSIVCYSWCTPAFILGTPMVEPRPLEDWARISSQNRWSGVIFAGDVNSRIVPQVRAKDGRVTYNAQWSVQRKGTLICQKLRSNAGGGERGIWFSKAGLSNRSEKNGWVFVEASKAYAAVRVVNGATAWQAGEDASHLPGGEWLQCADEWTPVILEVACKEDFANYEAFQKAVADLPLSFNDDVLRYKGLSDDDFTFHCDQQKDPEVNGRPIDYAPSKVLDSPFVKGDWNEGVVTIAKGGRELVLDFTRE